MNIDLKKKNKDIIKTKDNSKVLYNDGREIKADNFEYFKLSNTLNANGNVEIEDSNKKEVKKPMIQASLVL